MDCTGFSGETEKKLAAFREREPKHWPKKKEACALRVRGFFCKFCERDNAGITFLLHDPCAHCLNLITHSLFSNKVNNGNDDLVRFSPLQSSCHGIEGGGCLTDRLNTHPASQVASIPSWQNTHEVITSRRTTRPKKYRKAPSA